MEKRAPFSGDQVTAVSAGLAFSLHSEFESVEGHAGRGLGYGNGGSNHLITPRCRHNAFNGLNGPQGSGSRRIHKICPSCHRLNGISLVWATKKEKAGLSQMLDLFVCRSLKCGLLGNLYHAGLCTGI